VKDVLSSVSELLAQPPGTYCEILQTLDEKRTRTCVAGAQFLSVVASLSNEVQGCVAKLRSVGK